VLTVIPRTVSSSRSESMPGGGPVATVIDAGGQRLHGAGRVDPGGLPALMDVAAHTGAVVDEGGVLAVAAHDLPAVVELDGLSCPGAGHVEGGDPSAAVPDESGLAIGRMYSPVTYPPSLMPLGKISTRGLRASNLRYRPSLNTNPGVALRGRSATDAPTGAAVARPAAARRALLLLPNRDTAGAPFRPSGCLDPRVFGAGRRPGSSSSDQA
jgi:hypothetical protein